MKPLDGIRVLEFSTMITASLATMMLADQGAHAIKVEPLELGDPMRYLGSMKGGFSALFNNCNRGKQSLRLDIKADAGREVIERLVAETDVVLCNYRPGVMDGLGLGPDQLCDLNPRLIYAAVSGFGTEGPHAGAPAYDPIIQAQAGFAAVQGQGQDGPQFMRSLMCDKATAYTACQAVTSALYVRERTGEGQQIHLSMMDAGLYFLFPDGFMHHTLLDDDVDHSAPLSELLYDPYPTKDGGITFSAATPAQQVGLLTALDRLDLFGDERFDSLEKLVANLDAFKAELAATMATFETEELLARLHENDVPAARPLDYHEVLAHPQYAANDSIDVATHPLLGAMHRVKPPARFGGERLQPASHSPDHGQHTAQVLSDAGYSEEQIASLVDEGVAKLADG